MRVFVCTLACMFVRMFVPIITWQHRNNQIAVLIDEISSINLYLQHFSPFQHSFLCVMELSNVN